MPFADLVERLTSALLRLRFDAENAALCARLFAETTRDGIYTHGVRRFPRFVATVHNGSVRPNARPVRVSAVGALERWDGQSGPGNLNAWRSMERAIELAQESGIGCVALANTNHWMRGGTYGWQAAHAGMIGICWTNTLPNVPPWGGMTPTLGNNPLVLAVPRSSGALVLDIAMSQFSYGALEAWRVRGEPLPVPGGFDAAGRLTTDAGAVEATRRPLPIGFWKGAGLSLMLDVIGAVLSGGKLSRDIPPDSLRETGVTQVFVAMGPDGRFGRAADEAADEAIEFLKSSEAIPGARIRYPGEETLRIRAENTQRGVPVEESVWDELNR
ncbi:MAG TPA: 3-dehydro-L-gulonate 2-dehydrogenase [Terracidiphilus sp.]|nr:3-dehydro-L-gulonate 2-dehydrogenase [Terracidiphilus sp.]